jgi:2-polyprenyl-6-methoxyphenol hydroxylase-like FAD-dependent oxidoreductase
VRFGTTIAARLRDGEIKLSDGSVQHYDVLVGADGGSSVVRTAGLGGTEPRYSGRWCWRFIADGWDSDDDTWHARLASGRSLVTVPLGKGAVFCYADIASRNGRPPGDWRDYFDDFDKSITDLLARAGQAYGTPITEVDQPYAFLGRAVLIGDAAHAMSPSMAQGVALAVEDALVLAETLSSLPVYEALSAYEQRRAPRIAWVRAQAHRPRAWMIIARCDSDERDWRPYGRRPTSDVGDALTGHQGQPQLSASGECLTRAVGWD